MVYGDIRVIDISYISMCPTLLFQKYISRGTKTGILKAISKGF